MSSERRSDGRRGAGIREWLSLPDPHRSFPCLDGMRALAAFGVFLFHAGRQTSFFFTDEHRTLDHLDVGVAVFFVISGFLIYRPFTAANLAGSPPPDVRSYFRRRALRIYPAYIVALVVLWRLGEIQITDRVGLLKHLILFSDYFRDTGGAGLAVAWTLTIEVSFYLIVPLWSALTRPVRRWTRSPLATELFGAAALTGFGLGSIWWFYAKPSVWSALRILPPALSSLGVGMLFAVLSAHGDRSPRWARVLRATGNPLWMWWALSIVAFIAMRDLLPPGLDYRPMMTADKVAARAWWVPVAFAAVLPLVFGDQRRGLVRWVLRSRPAVFAGTVSYAFYLWHSYVIVWLVDRPTSWLPPYRRDQELTQVGLALLVSLLIATASWYLVERPALRFARRARPAASPSVVDDVDAVEPSLGVRRPPHGRSGDLGVAGRGFVGRLEGRVGREAVARPRDDEVQRRGQQPAALEPRDRVLTREGSALGQEDPHVDRPRHGYRHGPRGAARRADEVPPRKAVVVEPGELDVEHGRPGRVNEDRRAWGPWRGPVLDRAPRTASRSRPHA